MPVPNTLSDLKTTPSANSPQGTESAKGTIDDYLRTHAAFIAQLNALVGGVTVTLASGASVAIGAAQSLNVSITGTSTITSFDNVGEGALRWVTFAGALTLTHNAASLQLPGSSNIGTAAGDVGIFKSLGAGNWKCVAYQRVSGAGTVAASGTKDGYLSATDWSTFNGKQAALGYTPLSTAGGTMTGSPILSNGVGLYGKDTNGVARYLTGVANDNMVYHYSASRGWTWNNFAGSAIATLTDTGTLSAVVVTETSDERKKENWRPLSDAQLDAFANMDLVGLFDWKDGSGSAYGGSAQQIREIAPWAVHEDDDGNLTVAYGGLGFAIQQATLRRLWGKK